MRAQSSIIMLTSPLRDCTRFLWPTNNVAFADDWTATKRVKCKWLYTGGWCTWLGLMDWPYDVAAFACTHRHFQHGTRTAPRAVRGRMQIGSACIFCRVCWIVMKAQFSHYPNCVYLSSHPTSLPHQSRSLVSWYVFVCVLSYQRFNCYSICWARARAVGLISMHQQNTSTMKCRPHAHSVA